MADSLLAVDDLKDDFEKILNWAIEFKKLWKSGDELALEFAPLANMTVGSIYEKPSTRTEFHSKLESIDSEEIHSHF